MGEARTSLVGEGRSTRPPAWGIARLFLGRLVTEDRRLPAWFHVVKLGEEALECWRAWSRVHGLARQLGRREELAEELADTVITAYIVAAVEGLDLDAAIAAKGPVLLTRDLGELGRG